MANTPQVPVTVRARHKIAYGINDLYNDIIDSLSVFTIAKLASLTI